MKKKKKPVDLREIQCQTDDYGGMLKGIWAWLSERFKSQDQNQSGFFSNDANELSFGRRRESDGSDSNKSVKSGTFGDNLELKDDEN